MKKIDVGQVIGVLANVGVIAGILFLATEVQQNNKFLSAEAIAAVFETRMARNEYVANNENLADLLTKNDRGEALSDVELTRLRALYVRELLGYQRDYFLFREGILGEQELRANLSTIRAAFSDTKQSYGIRQHWEQRWRQFSAPDFRAFIDTCVLAECEQIPR
jgi:hypothetical protein